MLGVCRTISRFLVPALRPGGSHSSRPAIADGLQQPTRKSNGAGRSSSPIWSCSTWGFPCHSGYPERGALLPHHFTLTSLPRRTARRYIFCGTIRGTRFEHVPPAINRHAALWRPDFASNANGFSGLETCPVRDCLSGQHPLALFHTFSYTEPRRAARPQSVEPIQM